MKSFKIKIFSRILLIVLISGFILRIGVMLWSFNFRQHTDILAYRDYGRIAFLYKLENTYDTNYINFGTLPNNQPPGSLYIIAGAYKLQIQIAKIYLKITHQKPGSVQWINGPFIDSFLRFPSILADLIIGIFIYLIVRTKLSEKKGIIASSLFIFNPVMIYNSSFFGQMDSLNNLFFYLSLYFLSKKSYFLTIFLFFISIFIKLSLLISLPILAVVIFISIKDKKKLVFFLMATLISAYILILPVSANPLWFANFLIVNWPGVMQNITVVAFNFWWMVFNPLIQIGKPINLFNFSEIHLINSPLSQSVFWGLPLAIWGFILFFTLSIPIIKKIIVLKDRAVKPENLFLLFSIITLIGFIFLPKMHDRYMYPVFPLLATYIGLKQKFLFVFLSLSLLNFINLYIVWHPMMIPILSYGLMSNHLFQWTISFLTVLVSTIFYIRSIKILYAKEK